MIFTCHFFRQLKDEYVGAIIVQKTDCTIWICNHLLNLVWIVYSILSKKIAATFTYCWAFKDVESVHNALIKYAKKREGSYPKLRAYIKLFELSLYEAFLKNGRLHEIWSRSELGRFRARNLSSKAIGCQWVCVYVCACLFIRYLLQNG